MQTSNTGMNPVFKTFILLAGMTGLLLVAGWLLRRGAAGGCGGAHSRRHGAVDRATGANVSYRGTSEGGSGAGGRYRYAHTGGAA